jgi:hypothetical protein
MAVGFDGNDDPFTACQPGFVATLSALANSMSELEDFAALSALQTGELTAIRGMPSGAVKIS